MVGEISCKDCGISESVLRLTDSGEGPYCPGCIPDEEQRKRGDTPLDVLEKKYVVAAASCALTTNLMSSLIRQLQARNLLTQDDVASIVEEAQAAAEAPKPGPFGHEVSAVLVALLDDFRDTFTITKPTVGRPQ